jgi:hypothetical protein
MALKPYRSYGRAAGSITKWFMNEVAEAGIIVVVDEAGTGSGLPGDSQNVALVPTSISGVPLGVLMTDVVDLDVSKFPHLARNHRSETTVCNPVEVMAEGVVHTNMLADSITPSPGDPAHYGAGGLFTTATDSVQVGRFEGVVQDDGYAVIKVHID